MADELEIIIPQTFLQKLLFYTTAFFILLGIFSLFAFLFLVPFVIDPAFTTIFMEFDPVAAHCTTIGVERSRGMSNCTWTSCKEGCTKDVFDCTKISVNYKLGIYDEPTKEEGENSSLANGDENVVTNRTKRELLDHERYRALTSGLVQIRNLFIAEPPESPRVREPRGLRDYDDIIEAEEKEIAIQDSLPEPSPTGLMGNDSEWYYIGAQLYPNVKGCGYPPMLNCSVWLKKYLTVGSNFTCYYSKIDPGLVMSDLDMWQVYMNLVYAMAIPIPSFIISVIYLTFAYFKIYNEEEEEALVDNPEEEGEGDEVDAGVTPIPPQSGGITPGSEAFREDLTSFGHQLKVAMADEMSRESLADGTPVNSNSFSG